jgi:hypothetical protein
MLVFLAEERGWGVPLRHGIQSIRLNLSQGIAHPGLTCLAKSAKEAQESLAH